MSAKKLGRIRGDHAFLCSKYLGHLEFSAVRDPWGPRTERARLRRIVGRSVDGSVDEEKFLKNAPRRPRREKGMVRSSGTSFPVDSPVPSEIAAPHPTWGSLEVGGAPGGGPATAVVLGGLGTVGALARPAGTPVAGRHPSPGRAASGSPFPCCVSMVKLVLYVPISINSFTYLCVLLRDDGTCRATLWAWCVFF